MLQENKRILDRYLMLCKSKGLTEETVKAFKIDLNLFLRFIGDTHLKEIDHMLCEDFIFYCQNERANGDQAIARKFTTLNNFFKTIIKKDYVDIKNPFDKLDKPKTRKKQRDHLTEDEIGRVFNHLEKTKNLRDLAIFSLLFSSGIRLSELYRLNKNDLDFNRNRMKVLGKGMKERIAIFDDYAKTNILAYLKTRDDNLDALFVSRENNRLAKRSIQTLIKNRIKESGVDKDMCTHHIRHSAAMYYLKNGMPLNLIQKILGHSTISTTQLYAHNNMEDVEDFLNNKDNQ